MKIESDIVKTTLVVLILCGVYGGVVFWPSQKQNKALASEIQTKQDTFNQMTTPDLEPIRAEIVALRAELRERSTVLPVGEQDDRVLHHVSDTLIDRGVTLYETSYEKTKHYQRFSMTPIEVKFDGRFPNAFEVIKRIESQGPPVRIESLELSGSPDDVNGQIGVKMELSSFFLPTDRQGGQP